MKFVKYCWKYPPYNRLHLLTLRLYICLYLSLINQVRLQAKHSLSLFAKIYCKKHLVAGGILVYFVGPKMPLQFHFVVKPKKKNLQAYLKIDRIEILSGTKFWSTATCVLNSRSICDLFRVRHINFYYIKLYS